MKPALLFLFCTLPLCGQSFSFGIKAGVPLGDALSTVSLHGPVSVGTQRWTAGATVEFNLPANVSIGADALYRRFSYASSNSFVVQSLTTSNTGHWEFPVYAKYRFGKHLLRPYVEAGFAFDRAHTSGANSCSGGEFAPGEPLCGSGPAVITFNTSQWGAGFLAGGGVEIKAAFLKIAPEVRYTRWQKGVFREPDWQVGGSERNQVEILVGVRY